MEVDSLTSGILADVRRAVFGATRSNSEQEPAGRLHDCTGEHFRRVVEEAVAAIRRFELAKVVVARAAQVEGSWRAAQVLRRLREDQSHCTIFAAAHRDACFLGATPEWLVRLRDGQARISCLAGTAPRGKTEEEDVRLGQELLHSPKNLEEHAFVLTTVRESLAGVAELQVAEGPVLMKLPNLQHLSTPVTAQAVDRGVLALVERLHPTPAVAGYPRQEALDFLRAHERLDRGGYAAPLGWVDRRGQGEFAVGLRSALLRGGHATVFAGCGIVADSDPESEYAESSLKMRPMLAALGATNGS